MHDGTHDADTLQAAGPPYTPACFAHNNALAMHACTYVLQYCMHAVHNLKTLACTQHCLCAKAESNIKVMAD